MISPKTPVFASKCVIDVLKALSVRDIGGLTANDPATSKILAEMFGRLGNDFTSDHPRGLSAISPAFPSECITAHIYTLTISDNIDYVNSLSSGSLAVKPFLLSHLLPLMHVFIHSPNHALYERQV